MALSAPRPEPAPDYAPQQHPGKAPPLRELLRQLEIPDCGCKAVYAPCRCPDRPRCDCPPKLYGEPCPHTKAKDHGLSLAEWAELLRAHNARVIRPGEDGAEKDGYGDPNPDAPAVALTREARLAVMERRAAEGRPLKNPDDVLDVDRLGVLGGPNYSERGLVRSGSAA
jgi:hypothetical protein